MKRRWTVWLGLSFPVIVGIAFIHPGVRWPAIGWVRGEAFYKSRPTSYWHAELSHYEETCLFGWGQVYVLRREPTKFETWVQRIIRIKGDQNGYLLLERDPQAVPVLLELLKYPDFKSRRAAATSLGYVGSPAKVASPSLVEIAQTTPDYALYKCAWYALITIGSDLGETKLPERPELTPTLELMP